MTSRSAPRAARPAVMVRVGIANSGHVRRGLRAAGRPWPGLFLGAGDDSDDLDIPEAALGPDKTAITPSA